MSVKLFAIVDKYTHWEKHAMITPPPVEEAAGPSVSSREAERLTALRRYEILDTAPEQEFDDITRLAAQICDAPIALISLVDSERQWFKSHIGLDACETGRDVSFCAHALHQQHLFIIPDALADARFAGNGLVTGEPYIRFYAGAPLVTGDGQTLGTLCVLDCVPRTLSASQQETLLALARMVIAHLELRRKTSEQAQMLVEREEAAQLLRESEARKNAILTAALDCIITINAQEEVLDWNPAAEATFGYGVAEAQGRKLSSLIIPPALRDAHKRGIAHFLATGEGPILNQRIEVPGMRKSGEEFPIELTIMPIRLKGQSLFTAYLRDVSERKASEELLHQAHERLERANEDLEQRVRERTVLLEQANHDLREADTQRSEAGRKIVCLNTELTQAYDATIEGWSRALDLRDKETEGHCQRVATLTLRLARCMGLGEAELVPIRRGALLHDIGKMGVPDQILLKPGPLSDDEWTVMRLHPTYAYEMLRPIDFLHSALTIPWCHHEKWDGTGYPRGLAGTQIPLAARLFAVADVWDALRSDRPYRAGWPEARIVNHLRSLSGTHFDPQAVAAFLQMLAEDHKAEETARLASADGETTLAAAA